jgi:hypothetical protein
MRKANGRGSVLIKVLAMIIAGLGLAAFNKAVSVLDGEVIKRTYRSRALATFQEQFGNVPTAAVRALIAFLRQMYASGQVTYTTGVFTVDRYVRGK